MNPRHKYILLGLALGCLLAPEVQAAPGAASGTGFYVNRYGYAITNLHVVSYCQRLTAWGPATKPQPAEVIARDNSNDLAIIRVGKGSPAYAKFSTLKRPITKDDRIIVVGYPLGATQPVTREGKVLSPQGPQGEAKWVQIADIVEKGNSGGPLIDSSGNIIGVIAAKAEMKTFSTAAPSDVTTTRFGVAVSPPQVKGFLDKEKIRYEMADTDIYLPTEHITHQAKRFLVNVRCEY